MNVRCCLYQYTCICFLKEGLCTVIFPGFYSESSEEALDIFNRENLFPIVCAGLQHSVYGTELAITAGM